MKRRKISGIKDIGGAAQNMLPLLAGVLVGRVLTKQLTLLSSNAQTGGFAKVGLGLVAASMTNGFLSGVGLGIAINGGDDIATPILKEAGIALLPPSMPSRWVAGIPQETITNPAGGGLGF